MNAEIALDASVPPSYNLSSTKLELFYPCPTHSVCFPYNVTISPGRYLLELYGAGGGIHTTQKTSTTRRLPEVDEGCIDQSLVEKYHGNTLCSPRNSAGSGGYIAGILTIHRRTKLFAHIGGQGAAASNGGYNGGGRSNSGGTSGGGATDIRVLEDDINHRIIVAGGGGGADDSTYNGNQNDGSGGAGGYPEGQGFWTQGIYNGNKTATQSSGFSFGTGESASQINDIAGAGGGWYGGYASNNQDSGAGGGSSFILTRSTHVQEASYKFNSESIYAMRISAYENGIWSGHGKIIITFLGKVCSYGRISHLNLLITFVYLLFGK